jgi:Na+/proline symporter
MHRGGELTGASAARSSRRVTPLLWGVIAYLVAQMLLGVWVSRRVSTESDYWVAGRRMGPTLTLFSVFATWFGAETCIGSAGAVYADGLAGGSADPFGYALCLLVMGVALAAPLWRRKLITLADLFRSRYSAGVERIAVLLMVPTSLFWAAAQIRAFAHVLSASSTLELELTIGLAALFVVVYTGAGGLLADAATDVLQGVVLIAGLVILGASLVADGTLANGFASLGPARLDPLGNEGLSLATLERWAIPVLGSLVAQELISRVSAARSPGLARGASVAAALLYLAVGMIPVAIGLAGPSLLPGLEDSEQILPRIAQLHLSPPLQVLFIGALISAILSTVDSALLAASSLLAHNLVAPLRSAMGEAAKLRLARGGVIACGIGAYALARGADSVYELVENSSAFGSAGLLVILGFAFTPLGGPRAALASLLAGTATWIAGSSFLALETPYLASLAAAFAAYLAGALLHRRPARA